MQLDPASFETITHTAFVVIAGAAGWVALKIKVALGEIKEEQAKAKEELIRRQQEIKDDLTEKHQELVDNQHNLVQEFNAKHAENTQNLAVHIAEDKANDAATTRTLTRIDSKLEQLLSK